jgi:thiamine-phosphate pyrophosphorylase
MIPSAARLMDANVNRVREGLRVCEDISRFIYEQEDWFLSFRDLRHQVTQLALERMDLFRLTQFRDSENDLGRGIDAMKKGDISIEDLLIRNLQRAKEGLRVLEEFGHQIDPSARQAFQTLRYTLYTLEKKIVSQWDENKQLLSLRHSG